MDLLCMLAIKVSVAALWYWHRVSLLVWKLVHICVYQCAIGTLKYEAHIYPKKKFQRAISHFVSFIWLHRVKLKDSLNRLYFTSSSLLCFSTWPVGVAPLTHSVAWRYWSEGKKIPERCHASPGEAHAATQLHGTRRRVYHRPLSDIHCSRHF